MKKNRTYYAGFCGGVRMTSWSTRKDTVYHILKKLAEQRKWEYGTYAVYNKAVPLGFNVKMALALRSNDTALQKATQAEWDALPVLTREAKVVEQPLWENIVKERRAIWPGVPKSPTSVSVEDVAQAANAPVEAVSSPTSP